MTLNKDEEKALWADIGKAIQIEGDFAHVDVKALDELRGDGYNKTLISKDDAIKLFRETSDMNGAAELYNPTGYMKLEDNLYDFIHDTYEDVYERTLEAIDGGFAMGTVQSVEGVLNDLNKKISHDFRKYMPEGVKYGDLKFIEPTPETEEIVERFVEQRVRLTQSMAIRRSVEKATIERIDANMKSIGEEFRGQVAYDIETRNREMEAETFVTSLGEISSTENSIEQ